jgi:NAD(P)-dependent dehydrogenase (short-subunit alcohol dehydrogenase family)
MEEQRFAVITGSTKGWGWAVADGLASTGVHVLVNGRGEDVELVVDAIRNKGGHAEGARYATDGPEGINRLMDQALDVFGQVDIWVNSLGFQNPQPLLTSDLETWNEILRIQLTSYYLGTQRAAQQMVLQGHGGRILNVVGGGAYGIPGAAAHSASKGGALSATYSWAGELSEYGITVNAIRGGVQSPGMRAYMGGMGILDESAEIDDATYRKFGFYPPEMAAPLATWLASEAANDITGFHIGVDGPRIVVYDRVHHQLELIEEGGWTEEALKSRLHPALREQARVIDEVLQATSTGGQQPKYW